jgi:AraC family transcriptional regulator of adaptative response/methylated-DNA-[protein]-cysteine methyltransferase
MSTLLMAKPLQSSDDARWRAVLDRDASQDGRFVYAVHTTGVYCRPVCPSRRALRVNVSFYKSALAARAAGFRACKRCRPEQVGASDPSRAVVLAACRYIEAQSGRIPTLDELGEQVGLSPTHLQRVFKRVVGVSPRKYADALRVERLKKELQSGEAIAGALYATGYGSTSRLYESASASLGMTPSRYRKKAAGEHIRFVTLASPVGGHILVAATERGICAVRLGDRVQPLVDELEREFAGASFARGDDAMRASLEAKIAEGGSALADLPCDVRATAFQRRVWEAIRAIPEGSTSTYGALAAAIGNPRAVRAVAQACASNSVALLIPCHRVVPKAGGTGGYRWGEKRKRALLALEKKRAQG